MKRAVTVALLALTASTAEARLLNDWGGVLDTSYIDQKVRQRGGGQETRLRIRTTQPRVNLRFQGDLADPRLATYFVNTTLLAEFVHAEGVETDRETVIQDYSLGVTLLPRRTPLSLYAQRITREI